MVDAVSARQELDLRIGFAFTRFQTITIRPVGGALADMVLSYGISSSKSDVSRADLVEALVSFRP